jgi:hypothetical protein
MMVIDGRIMLLVGEAFVEADEETATEYCEKKQRVILLMIMNDMN